MTDNLPAQAMVQKETLTMAFLMLLENLTPSERAVFLLREVFAYSYAEIAEIVSTTPVNCRQMASRGKKQLVANRPRYETSATIQSQVINDFMAALNAGDTNQMLQLLATDVTFWSDGGGQVTAARHPVFGREAVARFTQDIFSLRPENIRVEMAEVNGTQSLLLWQETQLIGVMNFLINAGRIQEVRTVLNPDKLNRVR